MVRKALSIDEIKRKRQERAHEAKQEKEKEDEREVLVLESMDSYEKQDYDDIVNIFGEEVAKEKLREDRRKKMKVANTMPSNDLEQIVR